MACTANDPEDLVTVCKIAVVKACCGIKSLEDKELLDRLENLFLLGVKEGIKAKGEDMPRSLEKQYATPLQESREQYYCPKCTLERIRKNGR